MKRSHILWPRLLCEPYDDITPCPVRVIAAIAVIVYHIGIIYTVGYEHAAVGFGALSDYLKDMSIFTGASGLSLGVKSYMHGDAPQPGGDK